MRSSAAIGVFDSGIGGLTVAKEICNLLPEESVTYFGDLAHLPWGNKSKQTICNYALKITDFLLDRGCKIIVIACNTASSVALPAIEAFVGDRAHVINVIDPVVNFVQKNYTNQTIGLIATKQTVSSGAYLKHLSDKGVEIDLRSIATPLLVPMVEEGYIDKLVTQEILKDYLICEEFRGIKGLILGCTHYPLLIEPIRNILGRDVHLINSAELAAQAVVRCLQDNNLTNKSTLSKKNFYLSEPADFFAAMVNRMFPADFLLEHIPIWQ
jgi:glutamate racemase